MTDNPAAGKLNRIQHIRSAILALAAVVLTISVVWYTHREIMPAGPPQEKTWEDLQAVSAEGGYHIITTDELARRVDKNPESLLIVDTRQVWEYRTAHIKGAVVFPVETSEWWWFNNRSKLFSLIGPDKGRSIVFY